MDSLTTVLVIVNIVGCIFWLLTVILPAFFGIHLVAAGTRVFPWLSFGSAVGVTDRRTK